MKKILKVLLLSSCLINFSAGLLGPIYAIFVQEIGGDILTAGTSYAFFSITVGVLIFFLSKWEDKIKHQEKILVLARLLTFIGITGYLFVQSPIHLFLVQIILGFSEALGNPAYSSLYSKNLTKGKFASQWGYWDSFIMIAIGISSIIGSFIASNYGFKFLFLIMSFFSLLALFATILLIKKIKLILK